MSITYRILPIEEQWKAAELMGKCFPDYWEQLAASQKRFPYDEMSFAAESGGELAGHLGLMFFDISDGNGQYLRQAGVASVAVLPEYRKQGIAETLCRNAVEWAENENIADLPLFTGLFRVYEKSGWRIYENSKPKTAMLSVPKNPVSLRKGSDLTLTEQKQIQELYRNGFDFPGKVRRGTGSAFHHWPRIFSEPDFRFLPAPDGYIIIRDNTVAEAFFKPDTPPEKQIELLSQGADKDGAVTLALPESSPVWDMLEKQNIPLAPAKHDPCHGEKPMLYRQSPKECNLYFPLVDKF